MMRMLQNECFKMFRQKKLYIFMLILALMNSIVVLAYKSGGNMRTVIVTPNAQSLPLALLNETAQFMIIFIAIYIADIIADEYRNGTLKLTLLRPVGRIQWLNSKILALLVFSAVMIAFQIISAYITGIAQPSTPALHMLRGRASC
jgi:ABC-type transport system involved in multi-copper enzyme maturation permease subunit